MAENGIQVALNLCMNHHNRSKAPQICYLLSAVPSVARLIWEQSQHEPTLDTFLTMSEVALEFDRQGQDEDDPVVLPEIENTLLISLGNCMLR